MVDAAHIVEQIAAQLTQASALSDAAEALAVELARLRGIGESDDEAVRVTVNHHGIVIDILVRQHALEYTGAEVSQMVLDATQRAIEDVQAQGQPIRDALLPPELMKPMRPDLSDQLDALLDVANAIDLDAEHENTARRGDQS